MITEYNVIHVDRTQLISSRRYARIEGVSLMEALQKAGIDEKDLIKCEKRRKNEN